RRHPVGVVAPGGPLKRGDTCPQCPSGAVRCRLPWSFATSLLALTLSLALGRNRRRGRGFGPVNGKPSLLRLDVPLKGDNRLPVDGAVVELCHRPQPVCQLYGCLNKDDPVPFFPLGHDGVLPLVPPGGRDFPTP